MRSMLEDLRGWYIGRIVPGWQKMQLIRIKKEKCIQERKKSI